MQANELNSDVQAVNIEFGDTLLEQVTKLLNSDLEFSDIFIQQNAPLMVKQPRRMLQVSDLDLSKEEIEDFFTLVEANWKTKIVSRAFDRSFNLSRFRIRCNCFTYQERKRVGAVIRKFPTEPMALEEVGLRPNTTAFAQLTSGLVLVIGDTCQGKSTTLAAMVDEINKTRAGHILMIEDPVETIVPQRKCLITQRGVGEDSDVATYYYGAKDALRERPDVIVIGETRDTETAIETVSLAEAGPLIFTTLHAKSVELGLHKLHSLMGGKDNQAHSIANVLQGVLCQTLIPSKDGSRHYLATECMIPTPEILALIAQGRFSEIRPLMSKFQGNVGQLGSSHTLNKDILRLYNQELISPEDATRATNDRTDLGFQKVLSMMGKK